MYTVTRAEVFKFLDSITTIKHIEPDFRLLKQEFGLSTRMAVLYVGEWRGVRNANSI